MVKRAINQTNHLPIVGRLGRIFAMPRLSGGRLYGTLGQDVGAAGGSHGEASHYINNEKVRTSLYVCFADTGMD